MPQNLVQPPPIQRAIMNRHHQSRRSTSSIAPKSDPSQGIPPIQTHPSVLSPKHRPSVSNHSNSPSTAGSGFSPAASDNLSMRHSAVAAQRNHMSHGAGGGAQSLLQPALKNGHMARGSTVGNGAAFYPTPAFQNHYEQLGESYAVHSSTHRVSHLSLRAEQEYDAQNEMVDESEIDTPSGPGPYPSSYNHDNKPQALLSPAASTGPSLLPHDAGSASQPTSAAGQYPSMTQLLDQNLDWDPFGLSASMAFPTQQFQFDQPSMR